MIIKRLTARRGICFTLQGARLQRRTYSEGVTPKPRSAHAQWYSDTVPAMIPIFLLGSAVYLGLQLAQQKLSHEKFLEEELVRVSALEAQVEALQEKRATQIPNTSNANVEAKPKRAGWW